MKHQFLTLTAALSFAVFAIDARAQQSHKDMDMGGMKTDAANATKLTEGEVRNIDAKAGQVTLKHGAIENMKMPPMTMAFPVQDPSVLSSLKEGSKVKFAIENVKGVPTVTTLVPQK